MFLTPAGVIFGWRLQVRRPLSLGLFGAALALPVVLLNFAFTADYMARGSDSQYTGTTLGLLAEGTITPSSIDTTSGPEKYRAEVLARDRAIKTVAPTASLVIYIRETSVKFLDQQIGTMATGDLWEPGKYDPAAFRVSQGQMPTQHATAAISTTFASQLGATVGDEIIFENSQFTVVGIVERALDLKRSEVFFRTDDLLANAKEVFQYTWKYYDKSETQPLLAWNETASESEAINISTRTDVENRLRSYSQSLPLPLLVGAIAVMFAGVLLMRTLTQEQQRERKERLARLAAPRNITFLTALGTTAAVGLLSIALATLGSAVCVFALRQNVWIAGERIPGEIELPLASAAGVWLLSCAVLIVGLILPQRANKQIQVKSKSGQSGQGRLKQIARVLSNFRSNKWSRIGTSLSLFVAFALMIFMDTSIAPENYGTSTLAPGQFRILKSGLNDATQADTAVNLRTDELISALSREIAGTFVAVNFLNYQPPVSAQDASIRELNLNVPENGNGLTYIETEAEVAIVIDRLLTPKELQAYSSGIPVFIREDDIQVPPMRPLSEANLSWFGFSSDGNLGTLKVFTDENAPYTNVAENFIIGPAALKTGKFASLKASPNTVYILSSPGAVQNPQDAEFVQTTLAQFEVSATAVIIADPPQQRSPGLVSLVTLTVFAALIISLLELASRSVNVRGDVSRLLRLHATKRFRYRIVHRDVLVGQMIACLFTLGVTCALSVPLLSATSGVNIIYTAAFQIAAAYVVVTLAASTILFWRVK
ncbi:MAG: hypothetical protein RLZZ426_651 [Actinomycetota bacterium]|jgi:hypothetical protein